MPEEAPQATTPAEKQETQASPQAESAREATTTPLEEKATATSSEEAKEASSSEATPAVSTYQLEEKKNSFNNLRGSSSARLCWTCGSEI